MLSFFKNCSTPAFRIFVFAVITLSVLGLYGLSLGNGFVYDDEPQIVENQYIKSLYYIPQAFTSCIWKITVPTCKEYINYYRPVHTLSYIFTYAVSSSAFFFHLVNLSYYILLCYALFILFDKLLKNRWAALLSSLLFLFHPTHSEAVLWIASVPELLFSLFAILALLVHISTYKHKAWIAPFFYFLSLLSKEAAFGLPALFVLYDYLWEGSKINLQYFKGYWRYLFAFAIYLLMRISVIGTRLLYAEIDFKEQLYNSIYVFGEYIKKIFYPFSLNPYIPFESIHTVLDPKFIASFMLLAVFSLILLFAIYKKQKFIVFGIIFYIVFFVPIILFHLTGKLIIAERYLLLPSAGFALIFGYLLIILLKSPRAIQIVAFAATFSLLGIFAVRAYAQNKVWLTSEALYTYIHERNLERGYPSDVTYFNLASEYEKDGRVEEAKKIYEKIIANHDSKIPTDLYKAHNNYGLLFLRDGRPEEAIKYFKKSIKISPSNVVAYGNAGIAYHQKGMYVQAIEYYIDALRIYFYYFDPLVPSTYLEELFGNIMDLYSEIASLPLYSQKNGGENLHAIFSELLKNHKWLDWRYGRVEFRKATEPIAEPLHFKGRTLQPDGKTMIAIGVNPRAAAIFSREMMFYAVDGAVKFIPNESKTFAIEPDGSQISILLPASAYDPAKDRVELYVVFSDFRYYKFIINDI